ncbi:hypothetical protein Bca52824_045153 [Brassica carinata]|uniref:Uncharacterized protein n=1 Tax=Brassica carinata TaxID=52824 RepID=A0A8X7RHP6_BRACI|nr:hypothetical protein Bca52824_045153 [Brassica carinata]
MEDNNPRNTHLRIWINFVFARKWTLKFPGENQVPVMKMQKQTTMITGQQSYNEVKLSEPASIHPPHITCDTCNDQNKKIILVFVCTFFQNKQNVRIMHQNIY